MGTKSLDRKGPMRTIGRGARPIRLCRRARMDTPFFMGVMGPTGSPGRVARGKKTHYITWLRLSLWILGRLGPMKKKLETRSCNPKQQKRPPIKINCLFPLFMADSPMKILSDPKHHPDGGNLLLRMGTQTHHCFRRYYFQVGPRWERCSARYISPAAGQ